MSSNRNIITEKIPSARVRFIGRRLLIKNSDQGKWCNFVHTFDGVED